MQTRHQQSSEVAVDRQEPMVLWPHPATSLYLSLLPNSHKLYLLLSSLFVCYILRCAVEFIFMNRDIS